MRVPDTGLGEKWHLLANGLPLDFAPTRAGETAAELARRCAAAGAFVTIVHPEWYSLGLEDAMTIDAAHAVEVYNHTSAVRTSRGGGSLLDQLLAQGRRLNALASDDAHFLVDDAFGGWVMVKATSNEPELLGKALKAGHYHSTQGPAIHDIRLEGHEVVVECSPAFGIYLLGKGSRAVQSEQRGQTTARLPAGRTGKEGFMRVVLVDDQKRSASSSPQWREAAAQVPVRGRDAGDCRLFANQCFRWRPASELGARCSDAVRGRRRALRRLESGPLHAQGAAQEPSAARGSSSPFLPTVRPDLAVWRSADPLPTRDGDRCRPAAAAGSAG